MTLADGMVEAAVDIMNNKQLGVVAISPKAKSLIPGSILKLVTERRQQMMNGQWDPFQVHALVGASFENHSESTNLARPVAARGAAAGDCKAHNRVARKTSTNSSVTAGKWPAPLEG